MRLSRDEI